MRINYFFIFLFFTFSLFAQQNGEFITHELNQNPNDFRSNYFDKMIFKVDINSDIDNFYIPELNISNDKQSNFTPNEQFRLRFSFDYKFLGLTYSFTPDFISENSGQKANTRTLDLGFKFFYSDQWRQEVTFKKTTGFTLKNPDSFTPIAIFNDLQINTIGGKTFYIINKNFSYRAFETQTEKQIQSAGSVIPAISYYLSNLFTNNPNTNQVNLERIKSWDFIFQVGYMHNFVFNETWFGTAGIHPGIGINTSTNYYLNTLTNEDTEVKNAATASYNVDFNLALGYNHNNFFTGIKTNYKNFQYSDSQTTEILNSKLSVGLYVGYRFDEVKPIKKFFEKIEQKFGL